VANGEVAELFAARSLWSAQRDLITEVSPASRYKTSNYLMKVTSTPTKRPAGSVMPCTGKLPSPMPDSANTMRGPCRRSITPNVRRTRPLGRPPFVRDVSAPDRRGCLVVADGEACGIGPCLTQDLTDPSVSTLHGLRADTCDAVEVPDPPGRYADGEFGHLDVNDQPIVTARNEARINDEQLPARDRQMSDLPPAFHARYVSVWNQRLESMRAQRRRYEALPPSSISAFVLSIGSYLPGSDDGHAPGLSDRHSPVTFH
jgi:hypothetical protein